MGHAEYLATVRTQLVASPQALSLLNYPYGDLPSTIANLQAIYTDSGGRSSWTALYSVPNPDFGLALNTTLINILLNTSLSDLLPVFLAATLPELEEFVTSGVCTSAPWFTPGVSYCAWQGISCCLFSRLGACQAGIQSIQSMKLIGKLPFVPFLKPAHTKPAFVTCDMRSRSQNTLSWDALQATT